MIISFSEVKKLSVKADGTSLRPCSISELSPMVLRMILNHLTTQKDGEFKNRVKLRCPVLAISRLYNFTFKTPAFPLTQN